MARTNDLYLQPDPDALSAALDAAVAAVETRLRERLTSGSALLARELPATLEAFYRVVLALRSVVELEFPPPEVDVVAFVAEQAEKEADALAANAEARAADALRAARATWTGYVVAARRKAVWKGVTS